jgi:hypothetical protein
MFTGPVISAVIAIASIGWVLHHLYQSVFGEE